jgi:hypothetical protein
MTCKIRVRFLTGASICPFDVASRAHWTHPVFYRKWCRGSFPAWRDGIVKLTTHVYLVSRLRKPGAIDRHRLPTLFVFWCLRIQMVHCHIPITMDFFRVENVSNRCNLLNNLKISLFVGRVIGGCCWSSYVTWARRSKWRLAISLRCVFLFVDSYIAKRIYPGLRAGRSRLWFPMESLDFSIELILPAALLPWGRLSL